MKWEYLMRILVITRLVWKITMCNREINYFDWAIFKFAKCKKLPEGTCFLGILNGNISDN